MVISSNWNFISNAVMIGRMIFARIANIIINKTFIFKIFSIKICFDEHLVILVKIVLRDEDIINCPFDPSLFLTELQGCEFSMLCLHVFRRISEHQTVEINEAREHYWGYWFVLGFFIEVTSYENWYILMIFIEIFLYYLRLFNSLGHICWFSFEMRLSEYESVCIIWF